MVCWGRNMRRQTKVRGNECVTKRYKEKKRVRGNKKRRNTKNKSKEKGLSKCKDKGKQSL
jgi:hypothetical protein